VIVRAACIAALAAVTLVVAACGSPGPKSPGLPFVPPPNQVHPGPYLISLPPSSDGPTTCTVYEPDFATQIVVDSRSLNVRAECQVWAANQPGVGYLWGYEKAATTADALRVCTLTDPHRKMTASVIEDTGFVPVSAAQLAKGGSACAAIRASGWRRQLRVRRVSRS
jgi:hypothetical protein